MNNEIKERFIGTITESVQGKYKQVFDVAESYEDKLGKDLAEFELTEFENYLATGFELRTILRVNDLKVKVKNYVSWYADNIKQVDICNISGVDSERVYRLHTENILLYTDVHELLSEVNACEYHANYFMDTTHTDPDWCLRSKVVCILAWHGLTAQEIANATWHDIEGSCGKYTAVNGQELSELESDLLSKWFLKQEIRRARGTFKFPDTPYVLKAQPKAAKTVISDALKELNNIEKKRVVGKRYVFNTRNINMNGNFVRAAETEQQGGDYRALLGITDSTDKVYAAYLSRLYKLYKERIQF